MLLFVLGHPHVYECENLCRLFFPLDPVKTVKTPEIVPPAVRAVWTVREDGAYTVRVRDSRGETKDAAPDGGGEYDVTSLLFRVLRRHTGAPELAHLQRTAVEPMPVALIGTALRRFEFIL